MSINTWHHVVGTYDGTTMKIYVDNDLKNSGTSFSGNVADSILYIGWDRGVAGRFLTGKIDEVGIWSRALNSTEITELYNSGDGFAYPFKGPQCQFSGYVFDSEDNGLQNANVTITNQYDQNEYYNATTDSNGLYAINITNSTNTYKMEARYNGSTLGAAKHDILGTC